MMIAKNFLAVKLRGAFIYTQPCIQSNRTRPHVSRNSENLSAKIPKFRKVSKLSTPSIHYREQHQQIYKKEKLNIEQIIYWPQN